MNKLCVYYPQIMTSETGLVLSLTDFSASGQVECFEGQEIVIKSKTGENFRLSITAKKLFIYLLLLVTKYNNQSNNFCNPNINFTLTDYLKLMGLKDDRDSRNHYYDVIRQDFRDLIKVYMESNRFDLGGFISGLSIDGVGRYKDVKKAVVEGKAYFSTYINPSLLDHLRKHGTVCNMSVELFNIVEQNSSALMMGIKMMRHYSQSKGKENRQKLKVETLLDQCKQLTSTNYIKLRLGFETALNLLSSQVKTKDGKISLPIISWRYIYDDKLVSSEDLRQKHRLKEEEWRELIVHFELAGYDEHRSNSAWLNKGIEWFIDKEVELYEQILNRETNEQKS